MQPLWNAFETAEHLFLSCPFAQIIWNWLQAVLKCTIDRSSFSTILNTCDKGWGSQVQDVILAALINVVWAIWYCRNMLRFHDKRIQSASAITLVIASVSLTGNRTSGTMSSSMAELLILRHFAVNSHPRRAPMIKQVTWIPPLSSWVKCNTDGAARGSPGWSACGGIFRDQTAGIIGCFSANLGINFSLYAEYIGAMWAIELAHAKGWKKLWLECDSMLVVEAFKTDEGVPWRLQNRWNNCKAITRNMSFIVSHIFREGNTCADRLASHGLTIQGFSWWDSIPNFIREDFFRNRFSLPFFRFR